jgi:pimeloyl-ACP methyl ester carboxylesterase
MTVVPARGSGGYATWMPIRCFLGHGASGTSASMAPFVEGLRARGITATAIDLPKRKAEDALPAFHLVVPSTPNVVVGGHSFGGRVASLAAAEPDAPYAALVLFSYPLHPPGAPERTEARISHWSAIRCPVLLLSGEADPFAKIDLLRASVANLEHAELVTYPRLGHTLKPVLEDVLDRTATFLLGLPPR